MLDLLKETHPSLETLEHVLSSSVGFTLLLAPEPIVCLGKSRKFCFLTIQQSSLTDWLFSTMATSLFSQLCEETLSHRIFLQARHEHLDFNSSIGNLTILNSHFLK